MDKQTQQIIKGCDLRVWEVDPLKDPRWSEFLRVHTRASVFHSRPWLEAIQRTYGHQPVVITTSGPSSKLSNALVFCRVHSWLTGRRLVSLPFSDHCDPLVEDEEELMHLVLALEEYAKSANFKYIELRSKFDNSEGETGSRPRPEFYLHRLDLRDGADKVFQRFHESCIQRKIRRAQREGIRITEGTGPDILRAFYSLVIKTRLRQGLPPQSASWFANLTACMGPSAVIRCAWKNSQPIAAILTLQYGKSLYYKYGASDAQFHNLGAMACLLWHAIEDGIERGMEELDMGRSEPDNRGLITFKDRWGAERQRMSYLRIPIGKRNPLVKPTPGRDLAQRILSYMPDRILVAIGPFLYRHID